MKIRYHPRFKKNYKNRIAPNKKLTQQTSERINSFQNDPTSPSLKRHALTGAKRGLYSFSITGDVRIVYKPLSNDEVMFIDIGSHNQVY